MKAEAKAEKESDGSEEGAVDGDEGEAAEEDDEFDYLAYAQDRAMFFLGEYGNMTVVSAIATTLFLGGWSGPGVTYLTGLGALGWGFLGNILGLAYFVLKVYGLCFVFIWIRSTLPRLRADQLMQFAWLILIPVTLVNILITGGIYLIMSSLGINNAIFLVVLGIVNWLSLVDQNGW